MGRPRSVSERPTRKASKRQAPLQILAFGIAYGSSVEVSEYPLRIVVQWYSRRAATCGGNSCKGIMH